MASHAKCIVAHAGGIDGAELEASARSEHTHPHRILGVHPLKLNRKDACVVRAWIRCEVGGGCTSRGRAGWSWSPSGGTACSRDCLRIAGRPCRTNCGSSTPTGRSTFGDDPYRFPPTVGELDLHLFNEGTHRALELPGGEGSNPRGRRRRVVCGVGARTRLRVSIVGDFCRWDGRRLPMRQLRIVRVFELFVPGVRAGDAYKYEIKTRGGDLRLKSDPMATFSERPPGTASRVFASRYAWGDGDWMRSRASGELRARRWRFMRCIWDPGPGCRRRTTVR